jgi:hypothetical protein
MGERTEGAGAVRRGSEAEEARTFKLVVYPAQQLVNQSGGSVLDSQITSCGKQASKTRSLLQLDADDMTFGLADVFYLMDHGLAPTNQSKLSEVVLRLMASLSGSGVEV